MIAMTIAGFDPSGGAGILNDIKTFHALGVYGTAIITVLTAQNSKRVQSVESVPVDFIDKQIDTVLENYPIKYAKTGMLYSKENVKLISDKIVENKLNVVVDPVMIAGCGVLLSFEAEQLSGIKIKSLGDAEKAAMKIGKICDVVVTGGHLNGHNVFYNGSVKVIEGEIIESENTHGTGCSYSAALVAGLAKGCKLLESIEMAGEFVKKSVVNGEWGTLNQFYKFKSI